MGNSIESITMLVLQPSTSAIRAMAEWLTTGVSMLLLVVFLAALIDIPLQAFFFKSDLKMSHEEVKKEHKEAEGDPTPKAASAKATRTGRPCQRGRCAQG